MANFTLSVVEALLSPLPSTPLNLLMVLLFSLLVYVRNAAGV